MNDGTNIASDDIILKPKFRYWLMKNFLLITLAIFVFIFSKYIREHELLKFISGTILVLLIFKFSTDIFQCYFVQNGL